MGGTGVIQRSTFPAEPGNPVGDKKANDNK